MVRPVHRSVASHPVSSGRGVEEPKTLTTEQRKAIRRRATKRLVRHAEYLRLASLGYNLRVREDGTIVMRKRPVYAPSIDINNVNARGDRRRELIEKGDTIKLYEIDPADLVDIEAADVAKMFKHIEKRGVKRMTMAMAKRGILLREPREPNQNITDLQVTNFTLHFGDPNIDVNKFAQKQIPTIVKEMRARLHDDAKLQAFEAKSYTLGAREDGTFYLERPETRDEDGNVTQPAHSIDLYNLNTAGFHVLATNELDDAFTDGSNILRYLLADPNLKPPATSEGATSSTPAEGVPGQPADPPHLHAKLERTSTQYWHIRA